VDNKQLDLKSEDIESMDATKLSHFIQRNNLHLVTEYNPMTAIGLFNSMIPIHLLMMMNKASPEYEESLHRYQEAAKLFQGKILFILVDSGVKKNGKVISFFKLKKPQLPALAIYQTLDDVWDTLPITEVSVEHVQNFCDGFLKGKRLVSVRLQWTPNLNISLMVFFREKIMNQKKRCQRWNSDFSLLLLRRTK
ncbi:hypothetical protein EI555_014133, partial [Monodon monoceros]